MTFWNIQMGFKNPYRINIDRSAVYVGWEYRKRLKRSNMYCVVHAMCTDGDGRSWIPNCNNNTRFERGTRVTLVVWPACLARTSAVGVAADGACVTAAAAAAVHIILYVLYSFYLNSSWCVCVCDEKNK